MSRNHNDERLRTRREAARRYRKLGYTVVERPGADSLPPFLRRFSPDLIATRSDDRVVLEVKRAVDLKGSNEIKALAAAVDHHDGWRFELIALAPGPADVAGPSEETLDRLAERTLALHDAGLADAALIYAVSVLEELVRDAGTQHGIKGHQQSTKAIIRELAFHGVVGEEVAAALDHAWDQRNQIVHGSESDQSLSREAIIDLMEVCREVQAAMRLQTA